MRILLSYRGIPQSKGWATGDLMARAFKNLGHETFTFGNYYQTNERLPNQGFLHDEYDLWLWLECNDGDPQYYFLIDAVRAKNKVTWFFDVGSYNDKQFDSWFNLTELFDFNFIANKHLTRPATDNLKTLNIPAQKAAYFLPYAADKFLHFREVDFTKKTCDVSLIGSSRPERKALVEALRDAGIDAHLICDVYRESYIDALAASKIVLNDIAGGGSGMIGMRPWEAAAAGSFVLTPEGEGAAEIFNNVASIKEYSSVEDLVEKCNKILSAPQESYIFQVLCGQHGIDMYHTYESRCREIINKYQQHIKS